MRRYRYILFLLLVCGILGLSSFSTKERAEHYFENICDLDNQCFISGEQLVYKIFYNWKFIWVPAGQVHFNIVETDSSYLVDVVGKTFSSYDSFFKVRDRYRTIIDKETLLPKSFLRDISQGNYVRYDSMIIDQSNYEIREYYGKSKETAKLNTYQLSNCTQDLLSILYHLRNRDISTIEKGSKMPVSFFFSKKHYELDVNIVDRKKKKIKGLGKYNVIHARPELITGSVFDEDSYMDIYVSDDENKVPLMVESPLRIGTAKAVLLNHKNLKYELESLD